LSGEDLISGEFKRANAFKFVNHAKIIIATNSLPETTDKTNGFFARWIIVDFPNEFDNGVPVIDSIEEWEYENLCRKCVGILKDLLARGKFHNEGSMKMKEERYEEKSNPLKIFIDKYCRVDYDAMIPFWEFYEAYEDWHEEHTFRKLTKVAVGKWLKQNEYGVYSHRWSDKNWKTIFGIEFKRIKQSELK
jgi:putative DNA primase/helicase